MKAVFLLFFVSQAIPLLSQDLPIGLIIYKQFADAPDSLAKVTEFDKRIVEGATSTSFYPAGSRRQILVTSDRLIAVIHYPDLAGTLFQPAEIERLKATGIMMREIATRFPQTRVILEPRYKSAAEAMGKLNSGMILIGGQWQKKTDSVGAVVGVLELAMADGTKKQFKGGKIVGKTPEGLRIMHSAGSALVKFEELTEELQNEHGYDPEAAKQYRENLLAIQAGITNMSRTSKSAESSVQTIGDATPETHSLPLGRTIKPGNFGAIVNRLAKTYPCSGSEALLQKGKTYTVSAEGGLSKILFRQQGVLALGSFFRGLDFQAFVVMSDPSLLDRVQFLKSMTVCVGEYRGDTNGVPSFLAKYIVGQDNSGKNLILIRFPELEE